MTTLTATEYASATSLVYNPTNLDGTGFRLLTDPSGGLVTTIDPAGAIGTAFVDASNNIIIAFQGTTSSAQGTVDNAAGSGTDPSTLAAFQEAKAFVMKVGLVAWQEGYDLNQITVTGHSLGGMLAEYAAMTTGIGGAAFGATGLGGYHSDGLSHGFTSYVDHGDMVGNIGSDTSLAITSAAMAGKQDHYGSVVEVGKTSDASTLSTVMNLKAFSSFLPPSLKATYNADQAIVTADHTIDHYAADVAGLLPASHAATVSAADLSALLQSSKPSMQYTASATSTTATAATLGKPAMSAVASSALSSSMAHDWASSSRVPIGRMMPLEQPLSASGFAHALAQQLTTPQHGLLIKAS